MNFTQAMTLAFITALVPAGSAAAQVSEVLWSQPWNSTFAAPDSTTHTNPVSSTEVADDFELHAMVERLVVTGNDCFQCVSPTVTGVYVRFYESTASGPGAMLDEQFIASGDPKFLYDVDSPASLDITLPIPFDADGRYFVSVQLAIDGFGFWGWWVANYGTPQGSPLRYRENGGEWGPYVSPLGELNADLSFMIWGDDGTPPPPGTDPCGNWQVLNTPSPAGTDHAILRDVHAIAPDDVWAVGEYTAEVIGSIETRSMALHWDGSAWTIVDSPSPSPYPGGTWVTFDAVAATGPNDVWAAGGKRAQGLDGFVGLQLFVAHYDGNDWAVMDTPLTSGGSGSNVQDIEIIAPDDIWFFGDWVNPNAGQSNRALAMHWDGSNFTVVDTPFPAGGTPGWGLMAGSAVSPDDIWAVGGGSDGDYSASGYIIHWDGDIWTRVLGPAPGTYQRLYEVEAIAADDVWAVGDYFIAGDGYYPLFIHWDGESWTQVESPGGGRGLVVHAPDNIYSGGAGIVHWNGQSWQQVETFDSVIGPSIAAISAAGLCDIFAVGRQIIVGDILNFSARLQPGATGEFTALLADLNNDGAVDSSDRALFCAAIGSSEGETQFIAAADLNADGTIDHLDLAQLNKLVAPCGGDLVSSATFQPPADGVTDAADLAYLLGAWGGAPSCADFVSSRTFAAPPDGMVDAADLAYLLGAWGACD